MKKDGGTNNDLGSSFGNNSADSPAKNLTFLSDNKTVENEEYLSICREKDDLQKRINGLISEFCAKNKVIPLLLIEEDQVVIGLGIDINDLI